MLKIIRNAIKISENQRNICTTIGLNKAEDRKSMLQSHVPKDEGTIGERSIDIDNLMQKNVNLFPDEDTPTKLFFGIPFNQLPVCNIRVSPNNTIISITDYKGVPQLIRSCGIEGFKNAKKGTNIAAQTTAVSLAKKAIDRGFKHVRILVRGLGPGRMSAIKGVQMGGLNVISITDSTRVSWNPPRPRKQRKL